jgi:hypothetical protein
LLRNNFKRFKFSTIGFIFTRYSELNTLHTTCVGPRTRLTLARSDIMVLSYGEAHPLWYARVIGIFHVKVFHKSPTNTSRRPSLHHVLWVQWYGYDYIEPGDSLPFASIVPASSFGFVDPLDVIRGVHLIPTYTLGKTPHLLPRGSMASRDEDGEDYSRYYINM